jgi:DNA-binding transcriptional regulator YiaG
MGKSKENRRMQKHEIEELLQLRGWSRRQLAKQLDLTEDTVYRWMVEEKEVKGPASILMRHWLDQARRTQVAMPEPVATE